MSANPPRASEYRNAANGGLAPNALPQPLLFEANEQRLATLDPLARPLWLGGLTHSQGTLEPRLQEARAGQRAVFFVDAAHFVLASFLGWMWCAVRIFVKAAAGRQRYNVLGALNAVTHEVIRVSNTTYINADTVCQLRWRIAGLGLGMPITLVLDNARYQKFRYGETFFIHTVDLNLPAVRSDR